MTLFDGRSAKLLLVSLTLRYAAKHMTGRKPLKRLRYYVLI